MANPGDGHKPVKMNSRRPRKSYQLHQFLSIMTLPFQLCLAGDASAYGVGAVLSHQFPDGSEHLIAYNSSILNPSERNYAQVEKEALSLIFGLRKFHQYIYGRTLILC